jgi:hypothetical protein
VTQILFSGIGAGAGGFVMLLAVRLFVRSSSGRQALDEMLETADWLSSILRRSGGAGADVRPFPLSSGLLRLAVRRLPGSLASAEKERWAEEMAADLASVGGPLRRLLFVIRLLRKGAPGLTAAGETAPRSAGD